MNTISKIYSSIELTENEVKTILTSIILNFGWKTAHIRVSNNKFVYVSCMLGEDVFVITKEYFFSAEEAVNKYSNEECVLLDCIYDEEDEDIVEKYEDVITECTEFREKLNEMEQIKYDLENKYVDDLFDSFN